MSLRLYLNFMHTYAKEPVRAIKNIHIFIYIFMQTSTHHLLMWSLVNMHMHRELIVLLIQFVYIRGQTAETLRTVVFCEQD